MTASEGKRNIVALGRAHDALEALRAFVRFSEYALDHVADHRDFLERLGHRLSDIGNAIDSAFAQENPVEDIVGQMFPPVDVEAFAAEQRRQSFPYLQELGIIRLWSILEAAVDDLVIELLHKRPPQAVTSRLRGLEGPLLDYADASPSDQAEFLAQRLKQEVRATLKVGVGRFESLLDAIGLGGHVDDLVKRTILEHGQVRNLLVHRNGHVDSQFLEACPWLPLAKGVHLPVSRQTFHRYDVALSWYFLALLRRYLSLWHVEYRTPDSEHSRELAEGMARIHDRLMELTKVDPLLTSAAQNSPARNGTVSGAT